ncbi:unnamed protein product [Mycena citricolor]|uniref:Uncharacterized protein n=1 Tax=Mycena citricolor TaxID=2018698 RepID=A0AAD2HIN7_9AGAR|nr:unnamed protein product [Mycena citricolor]
MPCIRARAASAPLITPADKQVSRLERLWDRADRQHWCGEGLLAELLIFTLLGDETKAVSNLCFVPQGTIVFPGFSGNPRPMMAICFHSIVDTHVRFSCTETREKQHSLSNPGFMQNLEAWTWG